MKRTHLLLLCLVAMIAICLASCSQLPEIPGGSNLPGCVELFGSHTIEHVEAKDATCTADGNIEYWTCKGCGSVWTDSALKNQIDKKDAVLPQLEHEYMFGCDAHCMHCGEFTNGNAAHTIEHVAAKDATCAAPGNVEYWYCTDCGTAWTDAECTQLTNLMSIVVPQLACPVVHIEAVEPGCHYEGNIEYWICYDCERVWQDEALTQLTNVKNVILPATGHTDVVHFDAVAPACHYDGNVEYWFCKNCEKVWTDAALTELTNIKSVVLPATGGEVNHVNAVAANCHQNGNIEYWYCDKCEQVWQDAALTQLTNIKNVTIGYKAEIVHVEAVEAVCHQTGNVEYWYCSDCLAVFTDAALTQLSNFKSVTTPAVTELTYVPAVEAACHQNGSQEYWYCKDCDAVFADAAGRYLTNRMNLTVPYTAEITHVDAVAPTCHQNGNVEYWYCNDCLAVFTDAALTQLSNFKNVVDPATVGLTYVPEVEASCHQNGCQEYWYCEECEAVFADAQGRYLTNRMNLTLVYTAEIKYVKAVAPTCTATGNVEYWYCADCNAVFTDAALIHLSNFKSVILPELGHTLAYECDKKCSVCFETVNPNATHNIVHVEAVAPTCTTTGNEEHWYCEYCGKIWADENLTVATSKSEVTVALAPHEYTFECDAWCKNCYEFTNPEAAHSIKAVAAKASTCNTNGNIAHYTCEYCAGCWDNENATGMPLNQMMVKLPYVECETATPCDTTCKWCYKVINEGVGHTIVFVPVSPVTCLEAGCKTAHYYCTTCHSAWLDEALTQYTSKGACMIPTMGEHTYTYKCDKICNVCHEITAPNADHTIVHVEASAGDCVTIGNVEYWYCSDCGSAWLDEDLTKVTNLMSVKTTYGDHAYFYACDPVCMICYEITNPEATHTISHVAAKAPTCTELGNVEYWTCSDCGGCWDNANATGMPLNQMMVKLPMVDHEYYYACDPVCMNCYEITNPEAAHSLTHVAAKAPTCTELGNVEYWYCTFCGSCWDNENATGMPLNQMMVKVPMVDHEYYYACDPVCMNCYEITNPEATHTISHVAAKAPTCTELGNVEYWTCSDCGGCWDNANATGMPLNQMMVKVPATGHTYTNGKCSCGAINYGTLENPVSVSDALGACGDFTDGKVSADKFYVVGRVTDAGTNKGSYYQNVYITDGNKTLLIYTISMGDGVTSFKKGDIIIAYGYIKNYKGTIEMASNNSVYVYAVSVVDPCANGHDYSEATCTTPKTCKNCGATEGTTIDHVYVDGKCECGAVKGVSYITTTAKYSGTTTTNMTAGSADSNATILGLDSEIFTVTVNKGGNTNAVGLNKDGTTRLYANKSDGNGNELIISVAEGYSIKSIKIVFSGTNGGCKVIAGENVLTTSTDKNTTVEYEINADSFTLKNVVTGATTQVHIKSIEIVYFEN